MGRWRDLVGQLAYGAVALWIVAGPRDVRADDAPAAGEPAAYPRELWARPLLVPSGMIEADAWLVFHDYHNNDVDYTARELEPGVRVGLGGVELAAAVSLHLSLDDRSDPPLADFAPLQSVELHARHGVTSDGYVGVRVNVFTPSEAFHGYATAATLRYKTHSETRVAGIVGADLGYRSYSDDADPLAESYDHLFIDLDLRGQARMTSWLGFEASLLGHYRYRVNHDAEIGETVRYMSIEAGVSLVASLTDHLDARLSASSESLGTKLVAIGLAARGRP